MADRVGQQFGNYRLISLLGRGGFAEVYLGQHLRLNMQAAIKVLHTQLTDEDAQDFHREAETIASLIHPNIVRILDFDVKEGVPFLVMDYAPNGSLRQRLPKGVPLSLSAILSYVEQVTSALQFAHQQKLIHRDIKPENMLLGRNNEVLLSDFGIAMMTQSSRYQPTQEAAGTINYMPPEQIQGKPRLASDQYALGIVVYEWLCGTRPFHGSFTEIATQHIFTPPPPLREKVPTLPPAVEEVVITALTKDPQKRFASIGAFATALKQASQLVASNPPVPFATPFPPSPPVQPPAAVPPAGPSRLLTNTAAANVPSQPRFTTSPVTPPGQASQPLNPTTMPGAPTTPPPQTTRPYGIAPTAYGQQPTEVGRMPSPTQISQVKRGPHFGFIIGTFLLLVALVGSSIFYFTRNGNNPGSGSSGQGTTGTAAPAGTHGTVPVASTNTQGIAAPTGSAMIKIATDLPVSSRDISSGKPIENGAHLAVDQANANHTIPGYTLVFDSRDDVGPTGAHDPAIGAQNVTTLIGDSLVAGIVGPFNSNVARQEMPITNQAPIAQISPTNTNTCLTQEGADVDCVGANDMVPMLRPTGKVNYFRIAAPDSHQGSADADYLYKTLGYHSVYVIDDAEMYGIELGNGFVKEWQARGGTVLGHSSEPGTTTSYVPLLTQIAGVHPDVIYFGGVDSTGGILIRQQMEQVSELAHTPFAGGDGIVTSSFAQTIGLTGGPVYGSLAGTDITQGPLSPAAQTFQQQYQAVYGATENVYSVAGYDCANILIQAIKTALANGAHTPKDSSDTTGAMLFRQAVISAIQNISYDGVTGHQSFDANGDTTNKVFSVYQLATVNGRPDWKLLTTQMAQ